MNLRQNYWINRIRWDGLWTVCRNSDNCEPVCFYPAFLYDQEVIDSICYAENDKQVKRIVIKALKTMIKRIEKIPIYWRADWDEERKNKFIADKKREKNDKLKLLRKTLSDIQQEVKCADI